MTRRLILTALLGLLLAACATAGPRQIASYPADSREPHRRGTHASRVRLRRLHGDGGV